MRLAAFDDFLVEEGLDLKLTDVSVEPEGQQRRINRRDAARAVVDALTQEDLVGQTRNVWTFER